MTGRHFPTPRSTYETAVYSEHVARERLCHPRAYHVQKFRLLKAFTDHSVPGPYRWEGRDGGIQDVGATEVTFVSLARTLERRAELMDLGRFVPHLLTANSVFNRRVRVQSGSNLRVYFWLAPPPP